MKKYVVAGIALAIGLSLGVNNGHASDLIDNKVSIDENASNEVKIFDKSKFDIFAKSQLDINREMTVKISNMGDVYKLMREVYIYLPDKVTINTTIKQDELNKWISIWEQEADPENIINKHTLANYNLKKQNGKLVLLDETSNTYSASVIEKSLNDFALSFANKLEGKSDEEKFNIIYNFIFENYTYKASSYKEMLVGNMTSDTLACNGFSRLFYELSKAAGLESKIIKGEDHFWNRLYIGEDKWITIDLSTDIVSNKKHASTGTSRLGHEKLNYGNFFSSKYKDGKYKDAYELKETDKNKLIDEKYEINFLK